MAQRNLEPAAAAALGAAVGGIGGALSALAMILLFGVAVRDLPQVVPHILLVGVLPGAITGAILGTVAHTAMRRRHRPVGRAAFVVVGALAGAVMAMGVISLLTQGGIRTGSLAEFLAPFALVGAVPGGLGALIVHAIWRVAPE